MNGEISYDESVEIAENYEINQAKYYYRVAKTMMKYGYDDESMKKI